MVVLDYELNLSLQEYLNFQECPQKFRLYRILNPIPDKDVFLDGKRDSGEYKHRGYSDVAIDGIKKHHFFANFHQHYGYSIMNNIVPQDLIKDSDLLLFWKYQLQRYQDSNGKYPWIPWQTEYRAMTDVQRGIIDCVEYINNNEELRIIDYKKSKEQEDFEPLYFYAILLEDFLVEIGYYDLTIKDIGYYYYTSGELITDDYNKEAKVIVKRKIKSAIDQITEENLPLIESKCGNCQYSIVCQIENYRYK